MNARRLRTSVHHQLREAPDAFAYFALSIVWSAAVSKSWLPTADSRRPLGPAHLKNRLGRFLMAETGMPADITHNGLCMQQRISKSMVYPRSVEAHPLMCHAASIRCCV